MVDCLRKAVDEVVDVEVVVVPESPTDETPAASEVDSDVQICHGETLTDRPSMALLKGY